MCGDNLAIMLLQIEAYSRDPKIHLNAYYAGMAPTADKL